MTASPVVLVTGAARRVGAEIARTLHAAGVRTMLHYRASAQEAESLAAELNGRRADSAAAVRAELGARDAAARLIEDTLARFGRLDALVNNASSFFATRVGEITEEAWDDLVGSNFKGPLFLSQAAAPHLKQARGAIVNIVDVHAERPLKGYPLYCAAKAGLLGLTRALALELAPEVRVNAVSPGTVEWPEEGEDFPPAERDGIVRDIPLNRIGGPADIAATVKFLLFDAPFITGQVINVDGGRTAHL